MFDFIGWLVYLLFVEAGILFGILLRGEPIVTAHRDSTTKRIYLGTLGQFLFGFSLSFGFHAVGYGLLNTWLISTGVGIVLNYSPKFFGGRLDKAEVVRTLEQAKTAVDSFEDGRDIDRVAVRKVVSTALEEAIIKVSPPAQTAAVGVIAKVATQVAPPQVKVAAKVGSTILPSLVSRFRRHQQAEVTEEVKEEKTEAEIATNDGQMTEEQAYAILHKAAPDFT
jgi:hypothetical protein